MRPGDPRYLSYLVRMWRVRTRQGWAWRASLESPLGGERHTFPTFEHLVAFLRAQTAQQGSEGEEEADQ